MEGEAIVLLTGRLFQGLADTTTSSGCGVCCARSPPGTWAARTHTLVYRRAGCLSSGLRRSQPAPRLTRRHRPS
jgi:hypothetical protein